MQPQTLQGPAIQIFNQERIQRLAQPQVISGEPIPNYKLDLQRTENIGVEQRQNIEIITLDDSEEEVDRLKIPQIQVNNRLPSNFQIVEAMNQLQYQNPFPINSLPYNQAMYQAQNQINNNMNPMFGTAMGNNMMHLINQRQQVPIMFCYPNMQTMSAMPNIANMPSMNNMGNMNIQQSNEISSWYAQQQYAQKIKNMATMQSINNMHNNMGNMGLQQQPIDLSAWYAQQQFAQKLNPNLQPQYFQQQRNNQIPKSQILQTPNLINLQAQQQQYEQKKALNRIKEGKNSKDVINDVENGMVQINKTKVKINLKKLKEMEKDQIQIIEIDHPDSYNKKIPLNQENKSHLFLRKRVKSHAIESQNLSKEYAYRSSKIKTTRTAVHSKSYTTRKISTRRTRIDTPLIEVKAEQIKPQVFINNDGFMRIGQQYQADMLKIEPLDNLALLRKKLIMQRVWNGSKDQNIYQQIMEQIKDQVIPSIGHQDMLTILHSFKNNLPLLQKKLIDKDPLVAHELRDLKLSQKHKKRFLKISY